MDNRTRILSSLTGLVRSIEGNEDLISQDTIRMIQDSLVTIGQGEADENVTQYLVSVHKARSYYPIGRAEREIRSLRIRGLLHS